MIKDKDFYNRESGNYSAKRYPLVAKTYVQYFFKKRLSLVMAELKKLTENKKEQTLLEVGCADGVVVREIGNYLGEQFGEICGIDTAEEMIKTAREMTRNPKMHFAVRNQEILDRTFDFLVEIGVANYTDFESELVYAKEHLKRDGIYVLSIAGKDSSNAYFGRGIGYQNFLSYSDYEEKIEKFFSIKSTLPVGLYFPFVWTFPFWGRIKQPFLELFLKYFPNLSHEKVYILVPKV